MPADCRTIPTTAPKPERHAGAHRREHDLRGNVAPPPARLLVWAVGFGTPAGKSISCCPVRRTAMYMTNARAAVTKIPRKWLKT